ncbi:class I SAM-dependent methyltransferase [Gryllotalpicola reticulitermitis]|uniref:Class I SAM-dependent methyltransferase n=1 Tax=Gryllotalpicola reticulitermitis TaxID=1184153 RepID=A0ABV8QAL4_9MICO
MPDYDARLVDLYDEDNPDGPEHDFYRGLASERGATAILDLGCGTGILTVTFAQGGRTVVGVDPSKTMLDYAERRSGTGAVRWLHGDSRDIPTADFDFAVMTGNVAQHILDLDWARTLRDIRSHLRTGGTLAFESRNPARRAWETWQSDAPTVRDTVHGPPREWAEVKEIGDDLIEATFHNEFARTGDCVVETVRFAFRDARTLTAQLACAGFDVEAIYGDWDRTPFYEEHELLIVVARAR